MTADERLPGMTYQEHFNRTRSAEEHAAARARAASMSDEDLALARVLGQAASIEIGRRMQAHSDPIDERAKNPLAQPFDAAELVFAAYSRCPCGAGLAYPRGGGMHGFWDCSAILMGKALPRGLPGSVQHTDQLPFAFWKVVSEESHRAGGATTRPVEAT